MNKPDGSAFGNSLLAPFIEENNFLDIAITGSFIGGCVAATLEDARALFPNLKSAMLIDHCGAYSARSHADAFGRSQELLEQQGIKTPYMTKNGFWEALDYVSEPKRCDMRIVHSLATSPIT